MLSDVGWVELLGFCWLERDAKRGDEGLMVAAAAEAAAAAAVIREEMYV